MCENAFVRTVSGLGQVSYLRYISVIVITVTGCEYFSFTETLTSIPALTCTLSLLNQENVGSLSLDYQGHIFSCAGPL